MNEIQRLLCHVSDGPRAADVLRFALRVAQPWQAQVSAVHAVEPMPTGAYLSPEASTIAAQLSLETERARQEQATRVVASVAQGAGVELPFEACQGDPLAALLARARSADLLVLGQRDPEHNDGMTAGMASSLVVGSSCPLLFHPFAGEFETCGTRVLVAWLPSRESARALRDALPFLRRAKVVELVQFAKQEDAHEQPLNDALAHLLRHGVKATGAVRQSREPSITERMLSPWTPDASVAEALLSHAADFGADLIVMGGYGHSRAWELALGGVTRTILQSMTVPVLMSN